MQTNRQISSYTVGMSTNRSVIDEWANFSREDIEKFGDSGDATRQQLLDPTTFSLLGDVQDKTILDAGCGNGYLARKLSSMRATVTGIEPATNLFRYCVERETSEPKGITYRQEDLSDLADKDLYDSVVAINVFMDIPDYTKAIQNCVNATKQGGTFIFSILHPCFPGSEADWQKLGSVRITDYFSETVTDQKYGKLFHRPLQDYLNTAIESGCHIEKIVEPQLKSKLYERNSYVPQFIFIKATRY